MHKNTIFISVTAMVVLLLAGCRAGGDFTGREYMPDMAHSVAYESYSPSRPVMVDGQLVNLFADGKSAREPVKGTIPRGYMPYHYEDTPEGYEAAGAELVNPYNKVHAEVIEKGKALYNINCAICHGEKGDAKGYIVTNGKFPAPPPSYFEDRILVLSEGKMFHSVQHGKNLMGSYAGQLNKDERWKVISYIKQLQAAHILANDSLAVQSKASVEDILAAITGQNKFYTKGMSFPKVSGSMGTTEAAEDLPVTFVESAIDKIVAEAKDLKAGEVVQLSNVFYSTGKFNLRPESDMELGKLVTLLNSKPALKIEIDGHTDNQGDAAQNLALSTERAKAVYDYLVSKGIDKNRLAFKGFGSTKPAAPNTTEEGRAKNRRTEFRVL